MNSSKYRIFDGYGLICQDEPSVDFPSMRFTGQQDSKGQDVYECDILERGKARGVVEYDESTLRFSLRFGVEVVALNEASAFTVVGNAFENPEKV